MSTNMISNYKSVLAKKAAGQSAVIRQPRASTREPQADIGGFSLQELHAVKQVADRIGADKVRQLAEVLSR
jgi:hypothetical protein